VVQQRAFTGAVLPVVTGSRACAREKEGCSTVFGAMDAVVKRIRGEIGVVLVVVAALAVSGCSSASEPPVRIPAPALSIGVAPNNYGTLWLTAARATYSSDDGGARWRRVPGTPGGGSVAFLDKVALLAGRGQVWAGPQSGTSRLRRLPRPPVPMRAVSTAFYGIGRVYGLDTHGGLWVSVKSGARWSQLRAAGLPAGGIAIAARRAKTTLPDTVYVAEGPQGLWVSRNFGATFSRVPGIADATAVATTTHDATRVLVSTPAGLLLSTNDAGSFRDVLRMRGLTAVALDSKNWKNAFAATSSGLLLRSDDGGEHWNT
jgi:photosystem II stability/assembly factor-like uncharacterized protein